MGDQTTVNHSSLLATLELLYDPAAWIHHVDEVAEIQRTEVTRRVHVHYRIPDETDVAAISDFGDSSPGVFVPILTPRKDRLLDLQDIVCEEVNGAYVASHEEHLFLSRKLIHARMLQTWLEPLVLTAAAGNDWSRDPTDPQLAATVQNTKDMLLRYGDHVAAKLSGRPVAALGELDDLFSPIDSTRESHRVFKYVSGSVRPVKQEHRLYLLCRLLAERYLKFVCVPVTAGSRDLVINYSYRHAYREKGRRERRTWLDRELDPVRDILGAMPSHLRFYVPLARRTNHYTFRFSAPDGHFIHRCGFIRSDTDPGDGGRASGDGVDDPSTEEFLQRPLSESARSRNPSASADEPSVAHEVGGGAEALLMMADGSTSKHRLDCAFTIYEMPPGAAGFTVAVTSVTTCLMVLLVALRSADALDGSTDVASLVVAIAGYSGVVASPFLPRSDLYASAIFSRVGLLMTGFASTLFAVWLATHRPEGDFGSRLTAPLMWSWYHLGGFVCIAVVAFFMLGNALRFLTLSQYFVAVRNPLREATWLDRIINGINRISFGGFGREEQAMDEVDV